MRRKQVGMAIALPTMYIGYTSTTALCIYYSVLSNSWVGTN
jgi:hypothetical protein